MYRFTRNDDNCVTVRIVHVFPQCHEILSTKASVTSEEHKGKKQQQQKYNPLKLNIILHWKHRKKMQTVSQFCHQSFLLQPFFLWALRTRRYDYFCQSSQINNCHFMAAITYLLANVTIAATSKPHCAAVLVFNTSTTFPPSKKWDQTSSPTKCDTNSLVSTSGTQLTSSSHP